MLTDYHDDDREAAIDDARDDARAEDADLWRQAEAWSRLVEMEGTLTRLLDGKWYASAPSGRVIRLHSHDGPGDWEEMIHSHHYDEQIDAVNDCLERWVAAGRPRYAAVMPDDEPDERDGDGPYWPESEGE